MRCDRFSVQLELKGVCVIVCGHENIELVTQIAIFDKFYRNCNFKILFKNSTWLKDVSLNARPASEAKKPSILSRK